MAKTLEGHTAEMKTANPFKRKGRVGMNKLELVQDQAVFVKVNEVGKFISHNYPEGIDKFEVTNLTTGEEQTMWVDGGLRGQFSTIGGIEMAKGKGFEIIWKGQKPLEIVNEQGKAEKVKVNTYEVFELDLKH